MGIINTGNGYLDDLITVEIVIFLIFLAAFVTANAVTARRYHATKPSLTAEPGPSHRAEAAAAAVAAPDVMGGSRP